MLFPFNFSSIYLTIFLFVLNFTTKICVLEFIDFRINNIVMFDFYRSNFTIYIICKNSTHPIETLSPFIRYIYVHICMCKLLWYFLYLRKNSLIISLLASFHFRNKVELKKSPQKQLEERKTIYRTYSLRFVVKSTPIVRVFIFFMIYHNTHNSLLSHTMRMQYSFYVKL